MLIIISAFLLLLDSYHRIDRLTSPLIPRWLLLWWLLHCWLAWLPIVRMVVMDMVPVERTTCALATIELMEILPGFILTAPAEVVLCQFHLVLDTSKPLSYCWRNQSLPDISRVACFYLIELGTLHGLVILQMRTVHIQYQSVRIRELVIVKLESVFVSAIMLELPVSGQFVPTTAI